MNLVNRWKLWKRKDDIRLWGERRRNGYTPIIGLARRMGIQANILRRFEGLYGTPERNYLPQNIQDMLYFIYRANYSGIQYRYKWNYRHRQLREMIDEWLETSLEQDGLL
ncbi:hypothetical protein [Anaeroselena agilis]|uniref:Transposase n=1 Tax=Anaeroselena agilis TaxID=3063788 RepID=A0ABU3P3H8_9FIRM|nr:hypothetical protein [Selenomonadales bacterium 4137-cl]